MRHVLTVGLGAVVLVALGALVSHGSSGEAASASQYQYRGKPSLTLSISQVVPSNYYTIHVEATNYFSGSQPSGQLQLTCGGKKGSTCGPPPPPWPAGAVDPSGGFSFDYTFACGSNVKSAIAVDNDRVKSNQVKGQC